MLLLLANYLAKFQLREQKKRKNKRHYRGEKGEQNDRLKRLAITVTVKKGGGEKKDDDQRTGRLIPNRQCKQQNQLDAWFLLFEQHLRVQPNCRHSGTSM